MGKGEGGMTVASPTLRLYLRSIPHIPLRYMWGFQQFTLLRSVFILFIMCPAGTHRRPFAVSGLKPGVSYKSVLSGDGIPSTYSPASRTIYSEDFFLARIERAAGNGSLGYCGPVVSLKLNPQAIVSRPARRGSYGWRSAG